MSRRIRSLETMRTPEPCAADWDAMRGNDRVRFCEHCAHAVHDLSSMTRKDALRLVRQSQGRLCVRYTTLPGGRVKTLDPPGPLHQISRRASRVAAGAFGAALTLSAGAAAARTPQTQNPYRPSVQSCASPLLRQGESASPGAILTGTILDPAGAVIPGVTVIAADEATGEKRSAVTDDEGRYKFTGLGAGSYTLSAAHPGFKHATQSNVPLHAGGEQRLDLTLEAEFMVTETMGVMAVIEAEEPIVKAANEGDLKEVKRLLAAGADARVRDQQTRTTALDEAVARGDLRMARLLLDAGADARARSRDGLTPLMHLDADAPAELVRTLVAAGADVRAHSDLGNTPLGYAAIAAEPEVLRALVAAGAELDAINEDGKTALMLAAENGRADNVRALVEAGADVFVKDEEEKTALAYAVENGHEEVAELLRARGAVE